MLFDQNFNPYPENAYTPVKSSPGAFVGGTANARGDFDGTGNPTTIFTVTGDVKLRIWAVCTTDLVGDTATLELGVTGDTDALIAQTTATDIDANELWVGATPSLGVDDYADIPGPLVVANGLDIIETVGTANITAGELYYICLFQPLTAGSTVESAF